MRKFTKHLLALLLMVAGVVSASAKPEQVHATFENAAPTGNASWDGSTNTFGWSATSWNQLKNIGLPSGDLSGYKKLVVDCTITEGDQFRVLFYQDAANKTLYCKDGVNEFIIADALKEVAPDDWNSFLKNCTEVCLSGDNVTAPGSAIINSVYMETYPESEVVEIPDVVEEEDPGRPEGNYVDLDASLFNGDCVYNVGVKKAKGDFIYGATNQDLFADLSNYSKLTIIATPGTPLVLTFNHQIDFADKQNKEDYSEAEDGLYVWVDAVVDENGKYELDLTQFDPVDLNYIRIPWGFDKQATVWYMLLTEKESGAMIAWEYDFEKDAEGTAIVGGGSIIDSEDEAFGKVFQNVSGAVRSNYMTLPEDLFANSAESKELSIAFWVNANGNEPSAYTYAPFFTAYGSNSNGAANTWPMLALQSRGNVQVNCEGWCDFGADTQVDGKVNIYNQNAWEAGDANFNFVKNWLEDNNWHYYTVTFAETSVKQYLDGEITNEWTIDGSEGKSVAGLFSDGANLKYICLGGNQAWDWNDGDAPFLFDDVLVTNYVLTPEVIKVIIENKGYVAPEPSDKDAWFTDSDISFKVNDYPNGVDKEAVADPRWTVDPTDESNGCIIVTSNDAPANDYDAQLFIVLLEKLKEGTELTLTMRVRADRAQAGCGAQAHNTPGDYNHWGCVSSIDFTTEWADYSSTITVSAAMEKGQDGNGTKDGMGTIAFNLSDVKGEKISNNFYFDDIEVVYTIPTALKGIDTAAQKANGKYFQNGQIFIMKNGVKYNTAGQKIK